MSVTLVNLTGNIRDLIGTALDPRRTRIWLDTNIDGDVIIDGDGDQIYLGNTAATISADGSFTFTGLVATNSATNPTAFQYQVYVEYLKNLPQQTAGGKHSRWSSGWFSLTATADIADVAEESYVPPTWQSSFISSVEDIRDETEGYADAAAASAALAHDISNIDTSDNVVKALIDDPDSETAASLTALFVQYVDQNGDPLPAGSITTIHVNTVTGEIDDITFQEA